MMANESLGSCLKFAYRVSPGRMFWAFVGSVRSCCPAARLAAGNPARNFRRLFRDTRRAPRGYLLKRSRTFRARGSCCDCSAALPPEQPLELRFGGRPPFPQHARSFRRPSWPDVRYRALAPSKPPGSVPTSCELAPKLGPLEINVGPAEPQLGEGRCRRRANVVRNRPRVRGHCDIGPTSLELAPN